MKIRYSGLDNTASWYWYMTICEMFRIRPGQ